MSYGRGGAFVASAAFVGFVASWARATFVGASHLLWRAWRAARVARELLHARAMPLMDRRFVGLLATPTHALVELCPDAAIVHERGVVILANSAAARLVGAATAEELVGRDVATYLCAAPPCFGESLSEIRAHDGSRFPVWVRELALPLGGRVRRALVVRSTRPPTPSTPSPACPAVERALAALQPLIFRAARPTIVLDLEARLLGDEELLEQLASIMVLDALAALDARAAGKNRLSVTLASQGAWVMLEVVAERALDAAFAPDGDSFGVGLARQLAAPLGAELRVDTSAPGRRRLLATLLRA